MSFELKERKECPYCRAPRDFNQQYSSALEIVNKQREEIDALHKREPEARGLIGDFLRKFPRVDLPSDREGELCWMKVYVADANELQDKLDTLFSPEGPKGQSVALASPDQAKRESRRLDQPPGQAKGEGSSGAATPESLLLANLILFVTGLASLTPAPPKVLEWHDKVSIIDFVQTWLYRDDRSPFKQPSNESIQTNH